jgi:phage terminase small subunit
MAVANDKHKKFCDEYIKCLNPRQAYKKVYGEKTKDSTADVNASKLLKNTKVIEYLKEKQDKLRKRTEITEDMIIKELALVAFSDRTKYAKVVEKIKLVGNDEVGYKEIKYKSVEITNTDDLEENDKKVISGIKETKFGIEVDTYDKMKALELLGKHLGIFTDKVEHSGDIGITIVKVKK